MSDLTLRARQGGAAYTALVRERDLLAWAAGRYKERFAELQDADTEEINILATHQTAVRERLEQVSRTVTAIDYAFRDS